MATKDFVKFPRTPHLLNIGAPTRDDLVMTIADALEMLAHGVVIEEKVDGANLGISFGTLDGAPRCQKRGHWITHKSEQQFCKLDSWLAQHSDALRQVLGTQYILYGEWVAARHSVPYDALPDWFLAFDIYDKQAMRFLNCRRRDELLRHTGVRSVPSIMLPPGRVFDGPNALEAVRQLVQELRSALCVPGSAQWAEGIVLRLESDTPTVGGDGGWLVSRAKIVHPSFLQAIEGDGLPAGDGSHGRSGSSGAHWSKRTLQWNRLRPDLWPLPDPLTNSDNDAAAVAIRIRFDPDCVPDSIPEALREARTEPAPFADLGPHQNAVKAGAAVAMTAAATAVDSGQAGASRLSLVGSGFYVSLIGNAIDAVAEWFVSQSGYVPPGHGANRVRRDGQQHHITLVTPPEMVELQEQYGMDPQQVYDIALAEIGTTGGAWVPIGLGRARNFETGDEALFVVVAWPAGRSARAALGLRREQHFHITLGFQMQDVHGVPKGISSLTGGCLHEQILDALALAAHSAGARLSPEDRSAVLVLQVLSELQQVATAAATTTAFSSARSALNGFNSNKNADTIDNSDGITADSSRVMAKGSASCRQACTPTLTPSVIDCLYGILRVATRLAMPASSTTIAADSSTDGTHGAASSECHQGALRRNVRGGAVAFAMAKRAVAKTSALYGDWHTAEYERRRLFIAACAHVALARLAGWCSELDEVDEHVRQAETLASEAAAEVADADAQASTSAVRRSSLVKPDDLDTVLAAAACLYGKSSSQRGDYAEAASAFQQAATALERADPGATTSKSQPSEASTDVLVSLLKHAVTPSLDAKALRVAAATCKRKAVPQPQSLTALKTFAQVSESLPTSPPEQHQTQQDQDQLHVGQLRNSRERVVVHGVRIAPSVSGGGDGGERVVDVTLPRNTSWIVPSVLAGGSTPTRAEQITALNTLGVGLIITLTEEQPLPPEWFTASAGGRSETTLSAASCVRNLFVPVTNYMPPSVQQMDEILACIEEHVSAATVSTTADDASGKDDGGGAVLVHCGGGKGRAGTVLACYLCKYGQAHPTALRPPLPSMTMPFYGKGQRTHVQRQPRNDAGPSLSKTVTAAANMMAPAMSADAAVQLIRGLRPGSIETEEQRRFVGQYCDVLWRRYDRAVAGNVADEATTAAEEATTATEAETTKVAEAEATTAAAEATTAAAVSNMEIKDPILTVSKSGAIPSMQQQQQQRHHHHDHHHQFQCRRHEPNQAVQQSTVPPPAPPPPHPRNLPKLAMMVGLPGSGKSTFAKALEATGRWSRICQDECGSRGAAEAAFSSAMLRGSHAGWKPHVVLDRCCPDAEDRKEWLKLALVGRRDKGIVAVFFDVSPVECKARVAARTDHPTIPQGRGGRIVDSFAARLKPPTTAEGFERVYVIRDQRDAATLLTAWGAAVPALAGPIWDDGGTAEPRQGKGSNPQ